MKDRKKIFEEGRQEEKRKMTPGKISKRRNGSRKITTTITSQKIRSFRLGLRGQEHQKDVTEDLAQRGTARAGMQDIWLNTNF